MLRLMDNLVSTYCSQGRTAEAEALQEELLENQRCILGLDHPHTLTSMNNLTLMYKDHGWMAEVLEKNEWILGRIISTRIL